MNNPYAYILVFVHRYRNYFAALRVIHPHVLSAWNGTAEAQFLELANYLLRFERS